MIEAISGLYLRLKIAASVVIQILVSKAKQAVKNLVDRALKAVNK